MEIDIHKSWKTELSEEFDRPYFLDLMRFVKQQYAEHACYPKLTDIFAAFDNCLFEKTKVVIIGQDPYHGARQANGLCFSVQDGVPHPPSLINIFKELATDVGKTYPQSGNLRHWAEQGVLLLNATLTVRARMAGSHQNQGWEQFTDHVISILSERHHELVFLLWGGFAKKKLNLIDTSKHHVLTSGHPSPLSANRGLWFGNRHFSSTNAILKKTGNPTIIW